MIEEIIFDKGITMPGELIRLVLAFAGVSIATYYDVFNRKNIPDRLLYAFLAAAFIANLFFYQEQLFPFSLAVAVFLTAIGYIFYRVGQLGGADLFVLAALMLLLPIQPSFLGMPFNMPFIFPVMIFGGLLFALYAAALFGMKLMRKPDRKPNPAVLLVLVPYAVFAYFFVNSVLFSPVYFTVLTVLFVLMVFFMVYREDLMMLLAEKMKASQLENEDVIALELMDRDVVKKYGLKRLATESERERLKSLDIGEIWVYTQMPPFVPFILAGMFLALLLSKSLLFT
ncbi:prepilin peptidase [Candidatus Micrarchaeota archaeon]|nr:prepilin peptidase [Candidatus Micrarchaeota archaeon]